MGLNKNKKVNLQSLLGNQWHAGKEFSRNWVRGACTTDANEEMRIMHNLAGWARAGRGLCFLFLIALSVAPVFGQVSVLTQHNDNGRTGGKS